MQATINGPWTQPEVEAFFEQAVIPVRLGCVDGDGFPRVVSLWFRYCNGCLQCVTHRESRLAGWLADRARVGFEVAPEAPPYRGVRGRGIASLQALGDDRTLDDLLQRYLGDRESRLAQWLLSRRQEELLITIMPQRLTSWDYRERMADVGAAD